MTRLLGLSALLISCTLSGTTIAGETMPLHIDSQPIDRALNEFALQTGIQVLFPVSDLTGRLAPALDGSYTAETGLRALLAGTGLTYEFVDERTAAIAPSKPGEEAEQPRVPLDGEGINPHAAVPHSEGKILPNVITTYATRKLTEPGDGVESEWTGGLSWLLYGVAALYLLWGFIRKRLPGKPNTPEYLLRAAMKLVGDLDSMSPATRADARRLLDVILVQLSREPPAPAIERIIDLIKHLKE
jgi:hypothetical protein